MINFEKFPHILHYNKENLTDIDNYDNSIILDFFDVISYIVYTDFYTPRNEYVNNKSKLTISIPVYNLILFQAIKTDLEILLTYMTNGEIWNINFIKCENVKSLCNPLLFKENKQYNSISLFSGGLDALGGTVLEKNNNTLFISYQTNSVEISNAKNIYNKIVKNNNNNHIIIKKLKFDHGEHYTERTRSLMFLTSCLIYADYYKIPTINIYENGIMSLNPKFNFSRKVTKTTSPKTIHLYNNILKKLGINIKVINPFTFLTKGDVINQINNETYFEIIKKDTRTCSKNSAIKYFRNKSTGNFHCGVCIACVLRQIGININNLQHQDANYCLPNNLSKLKEIEKNEIIMSKNNEKNKDLEAAKYKYNEKKSLLNYYKNFSKAIENKTIYDYIDIRKEYFDDENWQEKIENMLLKFNEEIKSYLSRMGSEKNGQE